jgi:hypothetical protein
LLEALGCPASLDDEQVPQVGDVERPEDVGRAVHVQSGAERVLLVQALDDHTLVGEEIGLDPAPKRADVGVGRRGAPDDLEHAGDPELHDARVASGQPQLAFGIGLLDHLAIPLLLGDGNLVAPGAQQVIPECPQQAALGVEADVDGLERDAGLSGDRVHRRRGEAALVEQPLSGDEDVAPGRGSLRATARRVVAALGLDRLSHFRILSRTSLLAMSTHYPLRVLN